MSKEAGWHFEEEPFLQKEDVIPRLMEIEQKADEIKARLGNAEPASYDVLNFLKENSGWYSAWVISAPSSHQNYARKRCMNSKPPRNFYSERLKALKYKEEAWRYIARCLNRPLPSEEKESAPFLFYAYMDFNYLRPLLNLEEKDLNKAVGLADVLSKDMRFSENFRNNINYYREKYCNGVKNQKVLREQIASLLELEMRKLVLS